MTNANLMINTNVAINKSLANRVSKKIIGRRKVGFSLLRDLMEEVSSSLYYGDPSDFYVQWNGSWYWVSCSPTGKTIKVEMEA